MRRDRYDRSKIDSNQQEIVKKLRSIPGVTVELNHSDFLLGYKGKTFWYECKTESPYKANGELRKGALKDSQIKLLAEWEGHYKVVWTFEQILDEIMTP